MDNNLTIPQRKPRKFLPETFEVSTWEAIEPYYQKLLAQDINDKESLRQWMGARSELESAISEDAGWRYIKMTCHTDDEQAAKRYTEFVSEIQPKIAPYENQLNKKVADSPFVDELASEEGFDIMVRGLKKDIEIFREENIPLVTQAKTASQQYGKVMGAMTVEIDGEELTMQQAGVILQDPDRERREMAYRKISARRAQDRVELDEIFDKLVELRHQMGKNAGFANYRDYMFAAMGRFDYTPEDCFAFHEAVEKQLVPMLDALANTRKEHLKVDALKPWDKAVDPFSRKPLKPFSSSEELIERTIACFSKLDPFLGQCLSIMQTMGHLDLPSRKGKAPGGYNYPLSEIGVPFIFMNATSTFRDMITILHEGGHAVHSFLTRDLELNSFKHTPSEVAELASMSMELISMDHWDLFFDNAEDLKRAKREHLEQIIETLPWVATIDKFQHWIYENPEHSQAERVVAWNTTFSSFTDNVTNWDGVAEFKDHMWHRQLHLYEVPFYYIEYGMAQLGAIAVWKNYKEDAQKGLQGYMNALKLGYTRNIPAVYEAAGIRFDFSEAYIKELIAFVKKELESL